MSIISKIALYNIMESKKINTQKSKKIFLGGTCNNSTWRDDLIILLTINYFNPVVTTGDWTDAHQKKEIRERESSDFCLYVITPRMTGVYSIAEVVDDSNKRPEKTIFAILKEDKKQKFDKTQLKSLQSVSKLVQNNGAKVFDNLKDIADYVNKS